MAEAAESGEYDLPRTEGSDHITPIPGVIATVMTRITHAAGDGGSERMATDPDTLTRAEMEGRRQAVEYARFLVDRVPGYAKSSLVALSSQIGVRETRRVYGDYRLTKDDVLAANRLTIEDVLRETRTFASFDDVGAGLHHVAWLVQREQERG